ncbi:cytochrome c oxidase accessory protein CcoG [bacterium]|jgi:cytochrome c oxidase accessory protein FixG|nr:cytochrome c oxidase accessory protein CcoG [bacterium]
MPKKNASQIFELPDERLATTTETGDRARIYTAHVSGRFRTARNYVYALLIIIFLSLPWIKISGHQSILFSIPERKFAFFGFTFWAHEAPILCAILLSFLLFIGLITCLYGRIWCGWACPQTVFIDGIYQRIENWIEGKGLARKRFDAKPFTLNKIMRKTAKWLLFILVSLIISHSFLAYFVGAEAMIQMIQGSPLSNWTSFLTISISTFILAFNFGWFKEQFCIIACPYGRFQSVIMDSDSLVVGYDKQRGEPRKKDKTDTDHGDCINCYRCVQVCPTGIDIRRGTQMECIMCTACVDACDTVMTKIGKPTGLVRYTSENDLDKIIPLKKRSWLDSAKMWLRPRVLIYGFLFTLVFSIFIYLVSHRTMIPVHTLRQSNPPYTVDINNVVTNQFSFTLRNQYFHDVSINLSLPNTTSTINMPKIVQQHPLTTFIVPENNCIVKGGSHKTITGFLRFPPAQLKQGKAVILVNLAYSPTNISGISSTQSNSIKKSVTSFEVTLIGP